MNYYEHHIGDYAEATAHLSFIEDAAYSRLIRKYYASEKPLPADIKAVQRLVGARAKEERDAVSTILEEFFNLQDDGWHNKRCDGDLARYKEGDSDREQKSAHEKERMRRHREERSHIFAELREYGITPKWDTPTTQLRELLKRASNAPATRTGDEQERASNAPATRTGDEQERASNAPATRTGDEQERASNAPATANHTPDTNTHTPVLKPNTAATLEIHTPPPESSPPPSADPLQVRAIELSVLLRSRGAALQAADPRVQAWAADGVSDAALLTALEAAQRRRADTASAQPINAGLLDAILRDQQQAKVLRLPQPENFAARNYGEGVQTL